MRTDPELIRAEDVAQFLGVRRSTIYSWAQRGILPHYRVGRLLRFDRTKVEAWLAARRPRTGGRTAQP